jgi:hypothetical protein
MTEDMSASGKCGSVKLMGDIGNESVWCERPEERDGVVLAGFGEGLLWPGMSRKACEVRNWKEFGSRD